MSVKPFFDTNVLVYAFSQDDPRTEVSRILLATGGIVSVQVLNELTAVLRRQLKMGWNEVSEALNAVQVLCPTVTSLTLDTHKSALQIAERYGYQIFDSSIIASADGAKCKILYSEDMNDGQLIGAVTIRNPYNGKA